MRDDETTIKGNLATVIVRNDHGPYPERNRGQLYLELEGAKLTGLDANELRDAIDKAVGPRETAAPHDDDSIRQRLEAWGKVASHEFFDDAFQGLGDGESFLDGVIAKLDRVSAQQGYPAKQRDRHLRHIKDIEATLARRNRRHEEDQERIRELEGIAMRRGDRIDELEAKLEAEVAAPSPEEQIEALPIGHEVRLDPPRRLSEIPGIGKGGYVTRVFIRGYVGEGNSPKVRMQESGKEWWVDARHVIELGLRAEDFKPHDEVERERRKEYEDKGLADWEIELLTGA